MNSDKNREHRLALLALGLYEPATPAGDCPDSELLAGFVDGNLDQQRRQAVLSHISQCERCYEEWLLLAEFTHRETDSKILHPPFRRRNLRVIGSAVALAASVAIFFALPYTHHEEQVVTPMFKTMPQPTGENEIMLSAPAEDKTKLEIQVQSERAETADNKAADTLTAAKPEVPPRKQLTLQKTRIITKDVDDGADEAQAPAFSQEHRREMIQLEEQAPLPAVGSAADQDQYELSQFITRLRQFCENPQDKGFFELRSMLQQTQAASTAEAEVMKRLQPLFNKKSNIPRADLCEKSLEIIEQKGSQK